MVLVLPPTPLPASGPNPDLAPTLKALAERQDAYARYGAYYHGQHQLTFATSKFNAAFGQLFAAFADNLCRSVVDAAADRLQLVGFDDDTPQPEPDAAPSPRAATAAQRAWDLWRSARLPRLAGQLHQSALAYGDAYLIVWPDPTPGPRLLGEPAAPVFYPQAGSSMTVVYDPDVPGRLLRAAKWWRDDEGHVRLTLYYPDRLEKYRTRQRAHGGLPTGPRSYAPYQPAGEAWPLRNPYGQVPVFHFAANAAIGGFGTSELRDVLPLQNALNKSVADMLVAMEFHAMPQRYATGLEVDVDPTTGKPKAPFEPGGLWAVASTDTQFGQFAAAELTSLLEAKREFALDIARVSRTPIHHLLMTGEIPSGESLKTAEEPFVRKVQDRQVEFGDSWEDAMRFALRVQGVQAPVLHALWLDAAPRGEKTHAEMMEIKSRLGVSQRQVWRELGYDDDQIREMERERAEVDVIPLESERIDNA